MSVHVEIRHVVICLSSLYIYKCTYQQRCDALSAKQLFMLYSFLHHYSLLAHRLQPAAPSRPHCLPFCLHLQLQASCQHAVMSSRSLRASNSFMHPLHALCFSDRCLSSGEKPVSHAFQLFNRAEFCSPLAFMSFHFQPPLIQSPPCPVQDPAGYGIG